VRRVLSLNDARVGLGHASLGIHHNLARAPAAYFLMKMGYWVPGERFGLLRDLIN
jgi:hypothetical protein